MPAHNVSTVSFTDLINQLHFNTSIEFSIVLDFQSLIQKVYELLSRPLVLQLKYIISNIQIISYFLFILHIFIQFKLFNFFPQNQKSYIRNMFKKRKKKRKKNLGYKLCNCPGFRSYYPKFIDKNIQNSPYHFIYISIVYTTRIDSLFLPSK